MKRTIWPSGVQVKGLQGKKKQDCYAFDLCLYQDPAAL